MKSNFNLEEEVICNYLVSSERKKLWEIELDLLNKLDEICKKNNLKYFADSGTLLGAIRHKGFIPWDDDIDVVMPREDYNKLISLANEEFLEPYFLQCAYNDTGYYRGHAQLRNSNTTGILPSEANRVKFNQGIFLDIFPLDEVSKIGIFKKIKYSILKFYRKIFVIMFYEKMPKNKIKRKIKGFIKLILKNVDYKKMYKKYEKIAAKTFFKNGCVDKVSYYSELKKYKNFPKEYFEEAIYVPFENTKIPVSPNYDDILKKYYGENYMQPANVSSTHGEVIIDTENSYKVILERMRENEINKF